MSEVNKELDWFLKDCSISSISAIIDEVFFIARDAVIAKMEKVGVPDNCPDLYGVLQSGRWIGAIPISDVLKMLVFASAISGPATWEVRFDLDKRICAFVALKQSSVAKVRKFLNEPTDLDNAISAILALFEVIENEADKADEVEEDDEEGGADYLTEFEDWMESFEHAVVPYLWADANFRSHQK